MKDAQFSIGQRVGYKGRSPTNYAFMVGVVVEIKIIIGKDYRHEMYKMKFDDVKKHSGWRSDFSGNELEAIT